MTLMKKLTLVGLIATQVMNILIAAKDDQCYCMAECSVLADPYVTKFDGERYSLYLDGWRTLYEVKNYAVESRVDGAYSLYYQKAVNITTPNGATVHLTIEDCPYATKYIYNETFDILTSDETGLSSQQARTTVQCKYGPKDCHINKPEQCTKYLDVRISKWDHYNLDSKLNINNQTFVNIETNELNADGDCLEEPANNFPQLRAVQSQRCFCPPTSSPINYYV
jgi:hypothetical protein